MTTLDYETLTPEELEALRACALGEEVAQEIRDPERRDEGVQLPASAEQDGEGLLADQPQHATREHRSTHNARPPCELPSESG